MRHKRRADRAQIAATVRPHRGKIGDQRLGRIIGREMHGELARKVPRGRRMHGQVVQGAGDLGPADVAEVADAEDLARDLAEADATTLFQTNVGVELDAFDLVRLGMDGTSDFLLTVDGLSGVPLHLGRSRRLASVGQRIAMFAV